MFPLYCDVSRRTVPVLTLTLIALNLLLFAGWQQRVGMRASVAAGGLVPLDLIHGDRLAGVQHLFTHMFLHGGWVHLLGNMWFLWVFGQHVEDAIGSGRFVVFYLICGGAAACAHVYFSQAGRLPLVGASGAISGVLGAYLLLFPRSKVVSVVPLFVILRIIAVPSVLFLLLWMGLQIYAETSSYGSPRKSAGIAYLAHIGGFVAGAVLLPFFRPHRHAENATG